MSYRAAILLFQEDKIALIERHRDGRHYFTFPGGHIDPGETPAQAAVRETCEELGLVVEIERLVVRMKFQQDWQYYFLVKVTGGEFGTGCGEEILNPKPGRGTYQPCWEPLSELPILPIMPPEMVALVLRHAQEGWPQEPLAFPADGE